ncbi:MAG TPA: FAD-dependent oxidoreductase [Candidatus Acidoferrum sp.]|nr:FAD-dependent oxidoreductase [Candidatus Acidoferrum sp.]
MIGGGLAGIAAAVSAARHGLRVTLLAQEPSLGGIVTAALMDQWDFNRVVGGRSVQRGIFSEIYAQLGDSFTPAFAERVLTRFTRDEHVAVLTGMEVERVAGSRVGGERRIDAVIMRDAHGALHRFVAGAFIDATDDADVAALAGARYDVGRQDEGHDMKMQAATLVFTLAGLDWPRLVATYSRARYGYGRAIGVRAWGYGRIVRRYHARSPRVAVRDLNLARHPDGVVTVNAINVFGVDGRRPASVHDAVLLAREEAPSLVAFLRPRLPGFAHARVSGYAERLYVRETRHIRGIETLRESDVWDGRIPPDTIGLAAYPLDTHPVDPGDHARYAAERRVYGVPLGTLLPLGFTNLGLASRSISATHVAAGSARIIPTTIEEGEALGAACALAQRRGVSLVGLERTPDLLAALRDDLRERGVVLTPPHPVLALHARRT